MFHSQDGVLVESRVTIHAKKVTLVSSHHKIFSLLLDHSGIFVQTFRQSRMPFLLHYALLLLHIYNTGMTCTLDIVVWCVCFLLLAPKSFFQIWLMVASLTKCLLSYPSISHLKVFEMTELLAHLQSYIPSENHKKCNYIIHIIYKYCVFFQCSTQTPATGLAKLAKLPAG